MNSDDIKQLKRDVAELTRQQDRAFVRLAEDSPSATTEQVTYRLVNCEDETDVLVVCNELSASIGKVAVTEDKCYYIEGEDECNGCKDGCIEIITIVDTCVECLACYKMTNCNESTGDPLVFYSRTKLLAAYVGAVVEFFEYVDECFLVTRHNSEGCPSPVTITTPYIMGLDCANCDACYKIQNCGTAEEIYVSVGFSGNFPPHLGTISEPADLEGFIFKWDGECWEVVTYYADCPGSPVSSVDPIPTSQDWFAACEDCHCYKLTPCEGQTGPPPTLYVRRLVDADDGPIDLSEHVGGCDALLIEYDEDSAACYTVEEELAGCAAATTDLVVLEIYPCGGFGNVESGCPACLSYQLERCDDPEITICTYADLTRFLNYINDNPEDGIDFENIPPVVLKRAEDGFCYKLIDIINWNENCVEFTIEAEFGAEENACDLCDAAKLKLTPNCDDCDICSGGSDPISGGGDPIYSDRDDLFPAIGKWIKYEGKCYFVEATDDADAVTPIDCWSGPYESCADCIVAPSKIILSYLRFEGGALVATNLTLVGSFTVCGSSSIATEEC